MLQRVIVLFIVVLLFSCKSSEPEVDEITYIEGLFSSEIIGDWEKNIETLKKNRNSLYIETLFIIYLNRRYEPVREELGALLAEYIEFYKYDIEKLVKMVTSPENATFLIDLGAKLSTEYIQRLAISVYLMEPSDIRKVFVELIGKELIDETYLDSLFNHENRMVKLGVVSSCAYMTDELYGLEVRNWLRNKMFLNDDEVSSNALFSLSKHGSPGFLLLADNLLILSTRLQLVAIDILTFNKVSRAYPYYADLLSQDNPLLTKRVFEAYKGFSKKNDIYIFDALRTANPDLTFDILNILKEKRSDDFLFSIEFLLERDGMQEEVVKLAYQRNSWDFLDKYMLSDNLELRETILKYGKSVSSYYLFIDGSVKNITLKYFLENYELEDVVGYLNDINEDEKFINDYIVLHSIHNNIVEIESFELKNGTDPIVTQYFEFEQKKLIAKGLSDNFFNEMEEWLKNGDDSVLKGQKQSIELAGGNLKEERDNFINSLDQERREEILSYESNKLSVLSSYRQITYRLKSFTGSYINNKGFGHLIK